MVGKPEVMIHEEIVNFGESGALAGIFTSEKVSSTDSVCAIFLNAGLIHKIGPNRLYKKLSENYTENGFATFRFDFSGIGDSGYSNRIVGSDEAYFTEIVMAMDWLQRNKGIDKFLLSGICSGARFAFLTSLEDTRVVGLSLIDGIYADDNLLRRIGGKANQNTKMRYYKKNVFDLKRWIKLLTGRSQLLNLRNIAIIINRRLSRTYKKKSGNVKQEIKRDSTDSIIDPWKMLVDRGVKIQLVFCEGGTAVDIYDLTLAKQLSKYQKAEVFHTVLIKDVDHTFTPAWSQNELVNITISWLKKYFKKDPVMTIFP